MPQAGDYVEIDPGMTVVLDTDTAALSGLAVNGTLVAHDGGPVSITSDFIAVQGRFEIGTEADPFESEAVITLTGEKGRMTPFSGQIGNRALGVIGDGQLDLHGVAGQKVSWTQLAFDAQPGDLSIRTVEPVDWEAGDKIVLAPSGYDPMQAEMLTVQGVSGDTVRFEEPLSHLHLGQVKTFADGTSLDMRAEVGLLTRNIVIQGAEDSAIDVDPETGFGSGFGAHSIFRDRAQVRISGVEFTRTGQTGSPGRYAAHWHIAGDHAGDYIRDSSVHHSFQRAIVMHQTNNILAEDNVAFHIGNHAFIPAEDGNEFGNVWNRNLSVLSYTPRKEDFAFASANLPGGSSQGEFRTSGFWMKNGNHTFVDNRVAGVVNGMGYFFDRVDALPDPQAEPLVFQGNSAHTVITEKRGFAFQLTYPEITNGHALMIGRLLEGDEVLIEDFEAYTSMGGAWLEDRNIRMTDSVLADNGVGVFLMRSVLDDVTIVGESDSPFVPEKPDFGASEIFLYQRSGAVHMPPAHGTSRAPVIKDLTVINQPDAAIVHNFVEIGPDARVEKLELIDTPKPLVIARQNAQEYFGSRNDQVFADPNGQIDADGRASVFARHRSEIVDDSCDFSLDVQAFRCDPEGSYRLEFLHKGNSPNDAVSSAGVATKLVRHPLGTIQMKSTNDTFAYLRGDESYAIMWTDRDEPPANISMNITDAAGSPVSLSFEMNAAPGRVTRGGQSVARAASLSAFRDGSGSAWFHDAAENRLHVRFRSSEESYEAFIDGAPGRGRDAVRPSVSVSGLSQGLNYAVHPRAGGDAPRLNLAALPAARRTGTVGSLDDEVLNEGEEATVVYTGYIDIDETGRHDFGALATDIYDIWIGDTYLGGRLYGQVGNLPLFLRRLELEAGLHPVTIVRRTGTGEIDGRRISGTRTLQLRHAPPSRAITSGLAMTPDLAFDPAGFRRK